MLAIQNQKYLDEVRAFAEKVGKLEQLESKLRYLAEYACPIEDLSKTKCELMKDFAPYSFSFTMYRRNSKGEYEYWWNGGLIFHGAHDGHGSGAGPTFAVTLSPSDGWEVHS
jgi:hypothetical protein